MSDLSNSTNPLCKMIPSHTADNGSMLNSIIMLSIGVVGTILHVIGIFLLGKLDRHVFNQRSLLISLAGIEMTMAITLAISMILVITEQNTQILHYFTCLLVSANESFYCMMLVILVDRFLEVYLHLRYRMSYVFQYKIYFCIACWIFGLLTFCACIVTSQFICFPRIFNLLWYQVYPVENVLILFLAIVVYGYLYLKWRQSRRRVACMIGTQLLHQRRQFHIPFLILASFVVFIAIPDFINETVDCVKESRIMNMIYPLNIVSDACIYIFAQHAVRAKLLTIMKRSCCLEHN